MSTAEPSGQSNYSQGQSTQDKSVKLRPSIHKAAKEVAKGKLGMPLGSYVNKAVEYVNTKVESGELSITDGLQEVNQ